VRPFQPQGGMSAYDAMVPVVSVGCKLPAAGGRWSKNMLDEAWLDEKYGEIGTRNELEMSEPLSNNAFADGHPKTRVIMARKA